MKKNAIVSRHNRLFDLLKTGEIRANTVDTEAPTQAFDLRANDDRTLIDFRNFAAGSLTPDDP